MLVSLSVSNNTLQYNSPWTIYDLQTMDVKFRNSYEFFNNSTICFLPPGWIHLEEFIFTTLGIIITLIASIKIHLTEIRFHDYISLFKCYLLNISVLFLFCSAYIFSYKSTEHFCIIEQLFIQYTSTLLMSSTLIIILVRTFNQYFNKERYKQVRFIIGIIVLSVILQTILSSVWYIVNKHRKEIIQYHHSTCIRHIQIDLCLHAKQPLLFSTILLPINFILCALNIYRFTKPFQVVQLLESIMCSIGLIMAGSMSGLYLFFSSTPTMPFRYVAYVFLLTYILPRIWIAELERSRITVEEIKPLLHDESMIQFNNNSSQNCIIQMNYNDEEDENIFEQQQQNKPKWNRGQNRNKQDFFGYRRNNNNNNNTSQQQRTNTIVSDRVQEKNKNSPIIRTNNMSAGEILYNMLDKHDTVATTQLSSL
ncbi:unnamed protein product [Didymodactylos carnosus]|uniref:G-protein coupled receptors family 3 profile domain-containing protein n=1 Tax=Didymodactylos carnosus TaxID=1234261 RepID=A0A813ZZ62_9BILA|nr:unnamed protein product [Didymodactylos carnosus]CAF0975768.1 unnamed protein product [Didymodactylos carnosus]CAF3688021.1 unnamed protein product [Didymodactylos carnosus]CAF3746539.1 unnamed protein product [Didymodactylos carnosus]